MAETVGKIYSTALFELCCEQDSLETVYSEFTEIMQLLVSGEDEREYLRFLASPLISSADKTGSINAIIESKNPTIVIFTCNLFISTSRNSIILCYTCCNLTRIVRKKINCTGTYAYAVKDYITTSKIMQQS